MNLHIWDVLHTFMNRSIEAKPNYAPFKRNNVNAIHYWRLRDAEYVSPWRKARTFGFLAIPKPPLCLI